MKVQINSDSNVNLSAEAIDSMTNELNEKLERFARLITRLEVQLTDQNSDAKGGDDDIRCVIEARLEGKQPVSVDSRQANVIQAVADACDKLHRRLETLLGRELTQKRKGQREATRPEMLD